MGHFAQLQEITDAFILRDLGFVFHFLDEIRIPSYESIKK